MSWIEQYNGNFAIIQPPAISSLYEMLMLQGMGRWPMDREQAEKMRSPSLDLAAYERYMTRMQQWLETDVDLTDGDSRWSQNAWANDDELQTLQSELIQWEQSLPDHFRFRMDFDHPDINHKVNGKIGLMLLYYYTITLTLQSSYLPVPASWYPAMRTKASRRKESKTSMAPVSSVTAQMSSPSSSRSEKQSSSIYFEECSTASTSSDESEVPSTSSASLSAVTVSTSKVGTAKDKYEILRREAKYGFRMGSELWRKLKSIRHPLEMYAPDGSHGKADSRARWTNTMVTTTTVQTARLMRETTTAVATPLVSESITTGGDSEGGHRSMSPAKEDDQGDDSYMGEIEDLRQRVKSMWSICRKECCSDGRNTCTKELLSTRVDQQQQQQLIEVKEKEKISTQEQQYILGEQPQCWQQQQQQCQQQSHEPQISSRLILSENDEGSPEEICQDCLSGMCLIHGVGQLNNQAMQQLLASDFSIEEYLMLGVDVEDIDFDLDL
ncbi:hypothetical protein BGW42_000642 [Actinomortierella wolfii]|nr:hypothetical protein BGW42_000642 [Actinomortierella wolfii]